MNNYDHDKRNCLTVSFSDIHDRLRDNHLTVGDKILNPIDKIVKDNVTRKVIQCGVYANTRRPMIMIYGKIKKNRHD